jgi:hypothetical protein
VVAQSHEVPIFIDLLEALQKDLFDLADYTEKTHIHGRTTRTGGLQYPLSNPEQWYQFNLEQRGDPKINNPTDG